MSAPIATHSHPSSAGVIRLHPPLTTTRDSGDDEHQQPEQPPPPPDWLAGKWHVTHSTLPMWRSKRNVSITYTALPNAGEAPPKIDDLVEYQALESLSGRGKVKSVHGVDTPVAGANGWAWDWRGKGWLVVASSRWEVLGYGDEDEEEVQVGGDADSSPSPEGAAGAPVPGPQRQWVVTYFAKTLFTPAGVDLYSRHPDGLRPETVDAVKKALAGLADEGMRKLAEGLFEIQMDARKN
ncbi:hypothetical protein C8Q80DRAFT_1136993 [Daedaleopsis nitida]|nr:hypothetical protein C8Q80DRAFT_1136993 [Daedaleopsis nitida]